MWQMSKRATWKHNVLKVNGLLDKYFYGTLAHGEKKVAEWKEDNKDMAPQYQEWFVRTIDQPWWGVLCPVDAGFSVEDMTGQWFKYLANQVREVCNFCFIPFLIFL